jgi:hypothetical protein
MVTRSSRLIALLSELRAGLYMAARHFAPNLLRAMIHYNNISGREHSIMAVDYVGMVSRLMPKR